MSSSATPSDPESLAALHERSARHFHALLIGLAEKGAVLAGLYVEQAQHEAYSGTPGAAPSTECAEAFNTVTRSVRQSVMLAQKILEPAPAPKAAEAMPSRIAIRKQIIRRVEDAIHRGAPVEQAERLRAEFLERLEMPEFEEEIGQRPPAKISDEICADLVVSGPDSQLLWKRRTPQDVAALCARAAAPYTGDMSVGQARPDPRIRDP